MSILNNISRKKSNELSFKANKSINQFNNSLNQNNNDNNKTTAERCRLNLNLSKHKNKSCLFLKKINLKENKNRYYNKALEKLFFNKNNFFNDKYEGKKVIIGKENKSNKGIKEIYEYYQRQNRRKSVSSKTDLSSLTILERTSKKYKTNNISNRRNQKNFLDNTLANKTMPVSSKKEIKDYPISDNELKILFKNFSKRQERNKNRAMNLKLYSNQNSFNTIHNIDINKMLNLQEKIIKIKNKRNRVNKIISDKIMNYTFKDRDEILMNQKNDLLVIKGKTLDKSLSKFNSENPSLNEIMKNWVFSFRKNKDEEKQSELCSPEEFIYNNKNNEDVSFLNKDKHNNIRKLILQKNNISYKKNDINESNNSNLSLFHNLFIQGKNLLKQEINLSKELYGKKKKIYRYYFTPDEVSSMLVAKSSSAKKNLNPKSVINSMEIHKSP